MKKSSLLSVLAIALFLSAGFVSASEHEAVREKAETRKQEHIYGSQMMTRQERAEYRASMRSAKTAEEREQIRIEHHERMRERAKERNMSMPDEPPARGGGMGSGGGGMGSSGARGR